MDILVCNEKGLQLFNTFKLSIGEDFIYYTLFVCEQLELNPDKIDCCLLGEMINHQTYTIWLTNTSKHSLYQVQ